MLLMFPTVLMEYVMSTIIIYMFHIEWTNNSRYNQCIYHPKDEVKSGLTKSAQPILLASLNAVVSSEGERGWVYGNQIAAGSDRVYTLSDKSTVC